MRAERHETRSKKTRWIAAALATTTIVGCGVIVAACSNGGEGDPCNVLADNSGNDDCQDGLVCTPQRELTGAGSDLCCPSDRAQATTVACAIPQIPPGVDAAIPADSAPAGDSATNDSATNDGAAIDGASNDSASSDGATDGAAADGDDGG